MRRASLAFLLTASTFGCAGESPATAYFKDVTDTHLQNHSTRRNSMAGHAVDIDADGDLDLVIAIEFYPNVLLINDGSGRLLDESAKRLPRTRHDSEDLAVADFDGDGDLDLIFVSEDDQTNEFYENQGDATFVRRTDHFPRNGTSNAVQVIDANDDKRPDLLIGNAGQNFLFVNDGAGRFIDETTRRLPAGDATTQDLAVGDLDGDGDIDLIEGNETANRVLLNDGEGRFSVSNGLPEHNGQTRDVELADIDADGDLDVLFGNVDFGGVGDLHNQLLLNDGKGRFVPVSFPFEAIRTVDINVLDLNRDGRMDVLSGNRRDGNHQMVFLQIASGEFVDRSADILPVLDDYPFDFQAADFNGDGLIDIYFCNFQGEDRLLFGIQN